MMKVLFVAAATVAAWAAWLSWEAGYHGDPPSGPYSWWQVGGCVLTLAVIAVVAGRRLRPVLVILPMTVAFTAAWSVDAARSDDSGMWPVGAFLVMLGMLAGSAVISTFGRFFGGSRPS